MIFLFLFSSDTSAKRTNSISPQIFHFWCKIKGAHFGQYLVHKTPKKHILEQKILSAKMHLHSYTC